MKALQWRLFCEDALRGDLYSLTGKFYEIAYEDGDTLS